MKKIIVLLLCFVVFLNCPLYAEEKTFSLKDCLIYAFKNNPDIKSYGFKVEASFSQLNQARSAYFPSITGTSTYDRDGSQDTSLTRTFGDSLTITQLIYDFNKTDYSVKMADETLKQSEYDLYDKIQDVVGEVIGAYYDVLRDIHLVESIKRDVTRREKTLEQAEAFFEVGIKSKIDVTTARVNLDSSKLDLIEAENSLKVSHQSLYKAMGFNEKVDFKLEDIREIVKYPYSLEESVAFAFKEREDLKSLESQINSAIAGEKYNQRGWYPYLTAGSSYTWRGDRYPLPRSWNIGLNFNWPILDGGQTFWKVKESQANIGDLKAQYESGKNSIKKEVADYYSAVGESLKAIDVNKEKLINANENLELATERYRVGVGNIVELTQAQYDQIKAEVDAILSVYTYMKAKVALEKSTGINLIPIYVGIVEKKNN